MKNNLLYLTCLVALFFAWTPMAWGVTLSWQVAPENPSKEMVTVEVILDTVGQKINTVAGEINILEGWQLAGVSDANSLINFWIERPDLVEAPTGQLSFAGIIPGGYQGRGLLLTLELTPKNSRSVSANSLITVKNFTALLNDGEGQSAEVVVTGLTTSSDAESWRSTTETKGSLTSQPEPFLPLIVKDINFPTNQAYLVFATQDKTAGLAYYAVYESWWPVWRINNSAKKLAWVKANSPYQLRNQTWWNFIYVKAVNQAGEARLVKVFPQFSRSWLYVHWFISVIMLGVITIVSFLAIKWNRS